MLSSPEDAFSIQRSLPHGHVAAVLGTLRHLGMTRALGRKAERNRTLAIAVIVARVTEPASKLATARAISPETATSSIGRLLNLKEVTGNEMLHMLDWLRKRQPWIEKSLARKHLGEDNSLILHDVSSSHVEGRCCPLAAFGHNRDGKKGFQQIVYGLLCAKNGCPVAVEVFAGNTSDPATVASQVARVLDRFRIRHIALVGDRGMITTARIKDSIQPAGLDWISALTARHIRKLLQPGPLDPEDLVPDQVAEMTSPR